MRIIRYSDSAGKIGHASELPDGSTLAIRGDIFAHFEVTNDKVEIKRRLAPIVPSTIWCIALNYKLRSDENSKVPEYPVVFAKSPSALQNPGDPIQIPTHLKSDEVGFECELAVVIGTACKNIRREQALRYVLGYTCANDIGAIDWLRRGGTQWCRGKTFDTFVPLGPCLVTKDDIPDPHTLRIRTVLNGESVQDGNTNDMIFDVPTLIEFLSGSTTLPPGTVILTGTPLGVNVEPRWLKAGDEISIVIDKVGTLTNPVESEPE